MSAFWNLDKAKANKAGQSERIEGNSQITLKIISAAWVVRDAKNGSGQNYSLDLHVMNENKNKAHINIVYGNSLGERWSGENLINAIMTACNVPSLSQVQGNHEVYNFETKQDEIIQTLIAPELANKYFGAFLLLLSMHKLAIDIVFYFITLHFFLCCVSCFGQVRGKYKLKNRS